MRVLTGDIGGTNTRLMLAELDDTQISLLASQSYSSQQHLGLQQVANKFLKENASRDRVDAACFSVAGPVIDGTCKITNLPWLIDEAGLSRDLGVSTVSLVNDFTAVALGIDELDADEFLLIQSGDSELAGPEHPAGAILGAGTGLGVAHRVWLEGRYHILPSETGHAGFAPENELQTRLLGWLQQKHNHVSLEMLLSGRGLYNIYQFLSENNIYSASSDVEEKIAGNDPAQIITQYALNNSDELCQKTLDTFIEIYGASAGNVALQYYPVQELYLAGGIAPKIRVRLASRLFLDAFRNKGLLSSNLEKITLKLILNENVGLYGALANLRQRLF